MRFAHSLLVLPLALTFTAQAQSRRDIADPVCGVIHPRAEGPVCGGPTLFSVARSNACGPESYVQKKDKSCPGYEARKVDVNRLGCHDGIQGLSGWVVGSQRTFTSNADGESNNRGQSVTEYTCVRNEVIKSCRLPSFGVATWKSCRATSHAPERYPSCESPSFGAPVGYKVCSLVASTDEVASFLGEMTSQLPQTTRLYLANTASVVTLSNSADTLSCFIRKWENDFTALDVVADLKTKFASITGRAYDGVSPVDCTNIVSAVESSPACTDDSPLCAAQSSRLAARAWLEQKRDYALAIRDDLVAIQKTETRAAIESNLTQIMDALAK